MESATPRFGEWTEVTGGDPAGLLMRLLGVLRESDRSLENGSYSYSDQNSLTPSWIIQSAPDDTSCQFLDTLQAQLKSLVEQAPTSTHFIDITQMGNQAVDDAFQADLIASFVAVAKAARKPVIIRYLEGNGAGTSVENSMTFLEHLKRSYDGPASSNVFFYAVSFAIPWPTAPNFPGSWTHAKIFAIDGITAVVGGQNDWADYLPGNSPPHDVSIRVTGAATAAAHTFANLLWRYVQNSQEIFHHRTWQLGAPNYDQTLPPAFDGRAYPPPPPPPPASAVPILAVGNLGLWLPGELKALQEETSAALTNPAKQVSPQNTYTALMDAHNVLLDFPFSKFNAKTSLATQSSTTARQLLFQAVAQDGHLRMSQQKIADVDSVADGSSVLPWPGTFMTSLISAMIKQNATLDIIVSFHDSSSNSPIDGYSDDMGAKALYGVIIDLLTTALGGDSTKAKQLAAKLLTIKETIQATTGANHAKVWIVDDQLFYVGSDNIYPAYLQEFGYIVGNVPATQRFIEEYWTPIWNIATVPPK